MPTRSASTTSTVSKGAGLFVSNDRLEVAMIGVGSVRAQCTNKASILRPNRLFSGRSAWRSPVQLKSHSQSASALTIHLRPAPTLKIEQFCRMASRPRPSQPKRDQLVRSSVVSSLSFQLCLERN